MRKYKSSKNSSRKKIKYTFNTKSDEIMNDTHIFKIKGQEFKSTVKFISNPKEPFYKHITKEVE